MRRDVSSPMKFNVVTIFPELFPPFWENGILRRAIDAGIISAEATDIRDFTRDRHRTADDRPYGGGCGMVMKPEPLAAALRHAKARLPNAATLLMTPQGKRFSQPMAEALAGEAELIFVCGRYEGIDERFCERFIDLELSIGDFVMTGGELAAMVVMDAVTRLLPGALGGEDSAAFDSFTQGCLEHAHYTRPQDFAGEPVPDVLLSGNHAAIERWRRESALIRTLLKRPDLLRGRRLETGDIDLLKRWRKEIDGIINDRDYRGEREGDQALRRPDPLSCDR